MSVTQGLLSNSYLDPEYRRFMEEMARQQNYAKLAQMSQLAAMPAGQYVSEPEQPNPVLLLLGDSA